MAGLTSTGFSSLSQEEVIASLEARARTLFSDLVPEGETVDTSENSVLGRMIRLIAPSVADCWAAAQADFDAFNIDGATGIALDNLVAFGGLSRKAATSSTVNLILEGTPGTSVPVEAKVASASTSKVFSLVEAVTINGTSANAVKVDVPTIANSTEYTISYVKVPDALGEGTFDITITSDSSATKAEILQALADEVALSHSTFLTATVGSDGYLWVSLQDVFQKVNFTSTENLSFIKTRKLTTASCDDTGPVEAATNTVTTIKTPVLNWDNVYNPSAAVLGNDLETDEELRARFKNTKGVDGTNSVEAIYSALLALDGVTSVALYENNTDEAFVSPDPPVPPHSIYPIVQGGNSTLIAEAIWKNKAAGIKSFGGTTIGVLDSQGIPHDVSFDRPTPVTVYITMTVQTNINFPQDGANLIKQAIIDFLADTYKIGDDVEYSRLYTPINSIPGHYVSSLTIGTSPTPVGTSNISVEYNEIYSISASNIIVNVS